MRVTKVIDICTRRAACTVRCANDESAQGVVEFAILIVALMLMFLGVVDFSRFMYYDTAIRNAARVGAEVAGNYCNVPGCGSQSTATSDDYVMQATYCEATQAQVASGIAAISLQPAVDCTPCTTSSCDPCSSTSPYLGACTPCQKDICINPTGTRSSGSSVTVYVGYNFQPLSFYMQPFFPSRTCFPSGSTENTHTLCAEAVGRVAVP
jgi:Flp pilus assembly protein TadG